MRELPLVSETIQLISNESYNISLRVLIIFNKDTELKFITHEYMVFLYRGFKILVYIMWTHSKFTSLKYRP